MLIDSDRALAEIDRGAWARAAKTRGIMMVEPTAFDVIDVKNPHMEAWLGKVDKDAARAEWEALAAGYEAIGLEVARLPAAHDLVDQVFIANPLLMGADRAGQPFAILSRMRFEGRRAEVGLVEEWLTARGIPRVEIPHGVEGCFEGGGDALWHPDHYLLWAATGPRSDRAPLEWLAGHLDLPIALLELTTKELYHLDTCFQPLDAESCAWVPDALSPGSQAMIERGFARRIEVDPQEAGQHLGCNLYCPDRRHVFLPADCPKTHAALEAAGFEVRVFRTDEYLKSGGSIFCMRQEIY